MYNLKKLDQFFLECNIDVINDFIGGPKAIDVDKQYNEVDTKTLDFIQRLADTIRRTKQCNRQCPFRKIG